LIKRALKGETDLEMPEKKIKTGIPELDDLLGGGLFKGSSMLLKGAPGTGKTTLGMQFIYNGIVKYDEPGLIITFEEFPSKLYRDALSFGWDLKKLEEKDKLKVIFTSPEVFLNDLKRGGHITQLTARMKLARVLIDTVTYFQMITSDQMELRKIYNRILHSLEKDGITTVLTVEVDGFLNNQDTLNMGLAYLVDAVVMLRYVEVEGAIKKALAVMKTRGSRHEEAIREFEMSSKGIMIKEKFSKLEGILSGNTRKVLSERIDKFLTRRDYK
jgi:circadian clock protein KaiC